MLLLVGRSAGWIVCETLARERLAEGSYQDALTWLDRAERLNPALDQVAFYHIERGQAFYFLHPQQQSDDSRVFLAYLLGAHKDYSDAYQQIQAVRHADGAAVWVTEEIRTLLEKATEATGALSGSADLPTSSSAMRKDDAALPWLQLLVQNDPNNVYGRYMLGRIAYDIHDYAQCKAQMAAALKLSSDVDLQSSAYTYMAFSAAAMGDYVGERMLLLEAVRFDPAYHNNTAREELSGLR